APEGQEEVEKVRISRGVLTVDLVHGHVQEHAQPHLIKPWVLYTVFTHADSFRQPLLPSGGRSSTDSHTGNHSASERAGTRGDSADRVSQLPRRGDSRDISPTRCHARAD